MNMPLQQKELSNNFNIIVHHSNGYMQPHTFLRRKNQLAVCCIQSKLSEGQHCRDMELHLCQLGRQVLPNVDHDH